MSEDRLRTALPVPLESIKGLKIIEAGSGAGRFTEVLLKHGAIVYSFDLSNAVSNFANNMPHKNNYFSRRYRRYLLMIIF